MSERPIRIGNVSGYLGDRYTAMDEAMAGDPVDVLVGDYLSEITMASLAAHFRKDPTRGWVDYALDQLRPHLATVVDRGLRVVTNAGGFHPAGLAAALRRSAADVGAALRVAHVQGDNVLDQLDAHRTAGHTLAHLDTGAPLTSWAAEPIAANAYLGGWGIAAALAGGAHVVVCGRVTDASLVLGPAAWWHSWARDAWDVLAGALLAGHIIECGPQAVGGNFSGFTAIPAMVVPGFPIAEIAADGTSVITKHARDGGAVTTDTVTAQLAYEIQGPRYLNPDVTLLLDHVALEQVGPDRVRVTGATGSPPPPTTKVALFGEVGHQIVNTVFVTGLDIDAKIKLLRAQIGRDLPDGVTLTFTRIGAAADDPDTQWDATVGLRVMATATRREPLHRLDLVGRLHSLYLQSIPGYFHDAATRLAATPRAHIGYWPALLSQEALDHTAVLDDDREQDIAPPTTTELLPQPDHPEPEGPPTSGNTRRVPLGTLAHARSGDKGGDCNIGIWVSEPAAWPWLRQALSTAELRRLAPETKDLHVVRHEFPMLRAVHFVVHGLLGTGGSSNTRVDQVGKAVGEYLRAKHVPVPVALLGDGPRTPPGRAATPTSPRATSCCSPT